jgi:LuxR family transcriptional regulator, maltose regulon positive regulatory protein
VGASNAVAAALAFRALIALRHDRWDDAGALLDRSFSVIEAGHLHGYPGVALNHAVRARTAAHHHDLGTARAELSAAAGLLPTLTRALAPLAVPARLELARAAIALGDLPMAETFLADAQHLLADGLRFPVLQEDARQLAAAIVHMRTAAGPARLTPAELRLLPMLSTQFSYAEIAAQLFVSVHTVKAQVTSIYRKLDVSSRTQAINRGRTLGLLPPPAPVAPRR